MLLVHARKTAKRKNTFDSRPPSNSSTMLYLAVALWVDFGILFYPEVSPNCAPKVAKGV